MAHQALEQNNDPNCTVPSDEDYWCGHKNEFTVDDALNTIFSGCYLDVDCMIGRLCDNYSDVTDWEDYLDPATIPAE